MKKFLKVFKKLLNNIFTYIIMCILVPLLFYYGCILIITAFSNDYITLSWKFFIATISTMIMPALTLVVVFIEKTDKTKNEVNEYYDTVKNAIIKPERVHVKTKDTIDKDKLNAASNISDDVMELMLLNMKEIKEYYVLSKVMAKRSFTLSVVMCILGFIIISASIVAIFIIDISFAQSLAPIIGGVVVEAIAGTSLVVYKKSLEQLNQYYESLHSNERFLSLVNLVDKLSNKKRDKTYINIINHQLQALTNSKHT